MQIDRRDSINYQISKSAGSIRKLWRTLNSLRGCNSNKADNPTITMEEYVEYIKSIAPDDKLDGQLDVQEWTTEEDEENFTFQPITIEELFKELKKTKNNLAYSPDELPGFMLILWGRTRCNELLSYINSVLTGNKIPDRWKKGFIRPIPKSNNANKVQDFRPITIQSPLAKLFDRLCFQQLYPFIEREQLLPIQQHGFRKNKSTETALTTLMSAMCNAAERREMTTLLSLDMSKAFDRVSPQILLNRLLDSGISLMASQLLANRLIDRTCYIKFNEEKSSPLS